jgi:hypothetical protein
MRSTESLLGASLTLSLAAAGLSAIGPRAAQAGPVICTTTLEAPLPGVAGSTTPTGPVEVTRCGPVQTTGELVDRRAFRWRSTFPRGVSLTHQVTDLLGIAMGGNNGTKVMGFGFPDQAILWDASGIQNTYQALLEEQSDPIPWRSADLPTPFPSSLQPASVGEATPIQAGPPIGGSFRYDAAELVRGLW